MHLFKSGGLLLQVFGTKAVPVLLLLYVTACDCQQDPRRLSLPNPNADVIIIGEIVERREESIVVIVIDSLKGTISRRNLDDCWKQFGNTTAVLVGTSFPSEACGVIDEWPKHKEFILSLSANSDGACPNLMCDGKYHPILPAYLVEKSRIRRQDSFSTLCKLVVY